MARRTKFTLLGQEYPTKLAAAKAFGITEQTLYNWIATGNVDACALKHQRDNERHKQNVIDQTFAVKADRAKDPFNLRVAKGTYITGGKGGGLEKTSYKWEETPEFLAKVHELVVAGLEEDQVCGVIGIARTAFHKLKTLPTSEIIQTIAHARAERDLKAFSIRQQMIEGTYIAPDGKPLSGQTHASVIKAYIDREDKLQGRGQITVVHSNNDGAAALRKTLQEQGAAAALEAMLDEPLVEATFLEGDQGGLDGVNHKESGNDEEL